MVRIAGLPTTDQARLHGHFPDVVAGPHPEGLRQGQHALIDHLRARPGLQLLGWMTTIRRAELTARETKLTRVNPRPSAARSWRRGEFIDENGGGPGAVTL